MRERADKIVCLTLRLQIKYAKQTRRQSEFGEIKSRLASQRDETFRRACRNARSEFFTGAEMKLLILYADRLIRRADQIHLDPACFRVVNSTVLPPA